MNYDTFKNLLKNYYDYLKNVDRLKEEIQKVFYIMTGVSGIDYDKVSVSYNPTLSEQRKLELIEKKAELELELEYTILAIKLIEMKLTKLPDAEKVACLQVIAKKASYESYGNKMGYTSSGLWRKMKKDLERVLKYDE